MLCLFCQQHVMTVIEARDLLPLGRDSYSNARGCEGLYVVVSLFDATDKRVDSHTTKHCKPEPTSQLQTQGGPSRCAIATWSVLHHHQDLTEDTVWQR